MYKVETKKRKVLICILFCAGAIFCALVGTLHTTKLTNAIAINTDYEKEANADEVSADEVVFGLEGRTLQSRSRGGSSGSTGNFRQQPQQQGQSMYANRVKIAYDQCEYPDQIIDPTRPESELEAIYSDMEFLCGSDSACYE